jgi:hypothetical protein
MSRIDYKALITSQERAAQTRTARATAIKADCTSLITEVLDSRTLSNLHSAVLTGELDVGQMKTFIASQKWLRAMQVACRTAIESGEAPQWPSIPDGLSALTKIY